MTSLRNRATAWRNHATQAAVLNLPANRHIILFDVETTGLQAKVDRIIEFAAVKLRNLGNGNFETVDTFDTFINPGYPLPAKITELTGITDETLQTAPTESEAFEMISEFMGPNPIVGAYNKSFDISFAKELYLRHGAEFAPHIEIDVLSMARDRVQPGTTENYKLGTIAASLGINANWHRAIDDTLAMTEVFKVFAKEYFEHPVVDTSHLQRPTVMGVNFWSGYQGYSRIYVQFQSSSVYYDVRRQTWFAKDCDIDRIDMQYVEKEAFDIVGATNEEQFRKFTGNIRLRR